MLTVPALPFLHVWRLPLLPGLHAEPSLFTGHPAPPLLTKAAWTVGDLLVKLFTLDFQSTFRTKTS